MLKTKPNVVTESILPDYKIRSSHPEVFLGKGVLKICSKFTGEHPCRNAMATSTKYWMAWHWTIYLSHSHHPNVLMMLQILFDINDIFIRSVLAA